MTRSTFYPGEDGLEAVIRHKNLEIQLRRKIRELENAQKDKVHQMASNNQDSASELAAGSAFFVWVAAMVVIIILNFVYGWNVFWPIIGIGVGAAVVILALGFAINLGIGAYRASRRTRIN